MEGKLPPPEIKIQPQMSKIEVPISRPPSPAQQEMIDKFHQGGNPDQVLRRIAGDEPMQQQIEMQHQVRDIPVIESSRVKTEGVLGDGVSAVAHLAQLDSNSEKVVYKVAKNLQGQADIRDSMRVFLHLENAGIKGIARVIGRGVAPGHTEFYIQELIDPKGSFTPAMIKDSSKRAFIDRTNLKPAAAGEVQRQLRAEWAWGVLNDVLAPVHAAGVSINDAKATDLILDHRVKGGSVVKLIDAGNAGIIGDETMTFKNGDRRENDCEIIFGMLMEHGFHMLPLTSRNDIAWREHYEKAVAATLDPDLKKICDNFLNAWKAREPSPYKNGTELREAFRPVFEKLGVIPTASTSIPVQLEQPATPILSAQAVENPIMKGKSVRVQRSDGSIDEGWKIESFDTKTGEAYVTKSDGTNAWSKRVPRADLEKLNLPQ
jgi:hypothetical protein